MFETAAFIGISILTWRIIRSSYNQLAHYLNAGLDNEAITHESQLDRLHVAANRYYEERKWLAAEKAYLKVLKLDHKNIQAYRRLGMIYSHLHNYEDAAECLEMVTKSQKNAVDLHNLATVQFHNKRYDLSIDALTKAIELEPSVSRLLALAKLFEISNRSGEIPALIEQARRIDPDSVALARYQQRRPYQD
jgi:tetratricopeptide (TPR) repeat protein